jgi:LPS sulfotransferase NodH
LRATIDQPRWAFKTSWNDFSFLADGRRFASLFPRCRFIYIERSDIEAQAVSVYVAKGRGVWHAKIGDNIAGQIPKYDRAGLDLELWQIFLEKTAWADFFTRQGIVPIGVIYEHFAEQIDEAARLLLNMMGYSKLAQQVPHQSKLRKLGAEYEDLVWRYRKDRLSTINFDELEIIEFDQNHA